MPFVKLQNAKKETLNEQDESNMKSRYTVECIYIIFHLPLCGFQSYCCTRYLALRFALDFYPFPRLHASLTFHVCGDLSQVMVIFQSLVPKISNMICASN